MKKTQKIRYEVDPHNRLVCEKTGSQTQARGFRTVLDGTFEPGKDCSLIYHVRRSQGKDMPQQLRLRGKPGPSPSRATGTSPKKSGSLMF